jgi:hypothetical protein
LFVFAASRCHIQLMTRNSNVGHARQDVRPKNDLHAVVNEKPTVEGDMCLLAFELKDIIRT